MKQLSNSRRVASARRNDDGRLRRDLSKRGAAAAINKGVEIKLLPKLSSIPARFVAKGTSTISLALAVVFISAALAAFPLYTAYGNSFEITENRTEIDFPNGITFYLKAEAEFNIVSVALFYRLANARAWNYDYPDFKAGRQISLDARVSTTAQNYLPPGVQIEYYFSLEDTLGNRQVTPVQVVEYIDNRFEWETTRMGTLLLYHHDVAHSVISGLAEEVENGVEMVGLRLQLDLETEQPIRGFIYNNPAEARQAFPHLSRTTTERQVFHGFAFPVHQVFVGIGPNADVVVHESAHLLLHQAMGAPGGASPHLANIPAWLNEGFASYSEPDSDPYSGKTLSGYHLTLKAMAAVPGVPEAVPGFYAKSESVVAYLIEEHGITKFRQYLRALRQGLTADAAMASVYGFDLEVLDETWASSERGRNIQSPAREVSGRLNPLVYLDVWLFGGLILLVMATVTSRFLWRKLHRVEPEEEGLQPWEDPDLDFYGDEWGDDRGDDRDDDRHNP